ncbi:hypothetical protein GA0115254_106188 [Streptomyces sp. Ncost-T10-10d]|nr:hypothetical protein GA0115254_106188 [Streptomyces sp. Ncost-T10-10d]
MRAGAYRGDLGALSKRRRLITLDLRGTGDSSAPAGPAAYRCDRQVVDAEHSVIISVSAASTCSRIRRAAISPFCMRLGTRGAPAP